MASSDDDRAAREDDASPQETSTEHFVTVGELRPLEDKDTCLRPLGLCELGGSCDACWYRPDHPRFLE